MFFAISKILSYAISPVLWVVVTLAIAFIIKSKKWKKKLQLSALIMLLFFSNSFIVDEFIRMWEVPVIDYSQLSKYKYDAGIVLGGGMITKDVKTGKIAFRNNVDRILQTVDLYNNGIIDKIIISSGSGSLIYRDMLESALLKEYLVNSLNLPASDIYIDSLSDNTFQNAVYTSEIIDKHFKNGEFLLITSSIHIRRAKACFEKQNIKFDIFATNKISGSRRWDIMYLLWPDTYAIAKWQILLHEVTGYFVYYIKGYI